MKTYQICRSKVVYEILNTDVILINFETGDYYTLVHVAKQIWQLIELGTSLAEMVKVISNLYPGQVDSNIISADIERFIDQLLENKLIELSINSMRTQSQESQGEVKPHDMGYVAPLLQKYSDVQELLLLDPVHETSETGWPNVKQGELA